MKKILVGLMMVAMGLLLISPGASADSISVGDQVKLYAYVGNANHGGSFNVDLVGDSPDEGTTIEVGLPGGLATL